MKKAIFSLEGSSSSLDKKNDEDKEEYHEEEEDAAGQKTKLLPNQVCLHKLLYYFNFIQNDIKNAVKLVVGLINERKF